jgi:feruloyl esterase
MKWSRDLKIAKRSIRTALRAASAGLTAPMKAPTVFPQVLDFSGFRVPVPSVRKADSLEGVEQVAEFGSNPGRLQMLTYRPAGRTAAGRPLVVVLHGCGQGAAEFARSSGWMELADELGFSLVMPEQSGLNNQGRCFQWFQPDHVRRGKGEACSIRQMVDVAVRRFKADSQQVFVVGLSAGGAMAAALLADYPDVFAGGAIIAGLPAGAAEGVAQALSRMAHPGPERSPSEWAEIVRSSVPPNFRGKWPRISIWHGAEDSTVDPGNADLLALQWGAVHGLAQEPHSDTTAVGVRHRLWAPDGVKIMEQWTIPGMSHGYPIDDTCGAAAPHVLDVGVSASRKIAAFWDLSER